MSVSRFSGTPAGPAPARFAAYRRQFLVALALFAASEIVAGIVAAAYGHWGLGEALDLRYFCRWDCGWYGGIVRDGYHAAPAYHEAGDAANWAFFPLWPALAGALRWLTGLREDYSLLLLGNLFLLLCIFLFIVFVEDHGIAIGPWLAGSLVAFNPYVLYAHTGYTEPLYFALGTGALLALRRDRWIAAGLLGGASSATRLVGAFLVLPMLVRFVGRDRPAGGRAGPAPPPLEKLLGIALVPLGVSLFGWHLYGITGDLLAFAHIQVAWHHELGNPLDVWWQAFRHPGGSMFAALIALGALLAAVHLWRRRMPEYGLLLAATTLLPLSTTIVSMPRYVFWQPVFLLVLADVMQRRLVTLLVLPASLIGGVLMIIAWFAGRSFVV
jgi:hypothetical protein